MADITHAYVGYDADGTPVEVLVDDGSRDTSREAARYLRDGRRLERMTLEGARKVALYKKPEAR